MPELLDELIRGHHLVRAQEQEREQGALIPAADRDRNAICRHLERPQDPEVEH